MKAMRLIPFLTWVAMICAAALPVRAQYLEPHEIIREKKLGLSAHGGDTPSVALEYGFSDHISAGVGSQDGILLKGFVFAQKFDIYGQISLGNTSFFKGGVEMNIQRYFFGIELTSLTVSGNANVSLSFSRGFVGIRF